MRLFALLISLSWLASCQPANPTGSLSPEQTQAYLEKGETIAMATFTALSTRLQAAMKEGGPVNAIGYCNLAALPITDSLAQVHQARIGRTSLQFRNPANEPTPEEKAVLERWSQPGQEPKPEIARIDPHTLAYYAPIRTQALCLNCHGENLADSTLAVIQKLYPADKATGYKEGDLRGMWSIHFPVQ